MRCDRLWRNARLMTLAGGRGPLGEIDDGVIASKGGTIVYAGPAVGSPAFDAEQAIDCHGGWITPGLIDCHTHLVYGGNRADEFQRRLAGASYEEIARSGGGIVSTMTATRSASRGALVESALPRLDALIAEGVTTVEIKSGYGLSTESEIKLLQAARDLGRRRPVGVLTSFLGAHAVPPEFAGRADDYVTLVCETMIPAIAADGLADAVDGFCESIAFSPAQIRRVFEAARRHGLPVKLHAEQLTNRHGAALAAAFSALSADHLEHLDEDGAAAMARSGTTAVLLPGAYYFTRETKPPPVQSLRAHQVPMALATDCNPGTSPLTSPLLAMNMAATLFRLSVPECIAGFTREAARALGILDRVGTLEAGKYCDLAVWQIEHPAELVYRMGFNPLDARYWRFS